jgi:hypothetical protein
MLVILSASRLDGQATTLGQIVGTVVDPSGSVIPNAQVTVANVGTGVTREVKSDDNGHFAAISLNPAVYRVEVTAPSFQRQIQDNINLDVSGSVNLTFRLTVGQVTEAVNVTAEAELLKSTEGVIATTIENAQVVELPLNGRNFNNLIRLTPGATRGTTGGGETLNAQTFAVTGSRSDNANYTLDGTYNNGTFFKTSAINPSIDAIQEFRVQTNMSARYGAAAGANINVSIKSGTNELHGTAYEFLRNSKLDSRDYFAPSRRDFKWNQFGFTVGGPVMIPKLVDGRNKTFWFFNYEGFKQRRGVTQAQTIPTEAMLSGDLSHLQDGSPAPQIFDPTTTRPDPANPGQFIRTPFENNIIPASRIAPYATAYANLWWPSTLPRTAGLRTSNYINGTGQKRDDNQTHTRIDQKISENNNFFGRFSWADLSQTDPANFPNAFLGTFNKYIGVTLSDTHVFNPTTVLDVRLGYLRANLGQGPTEQFINVYRDAGLTNLPTNFREFDFPANFGIAGYSGPNLGNLVNGPDFTYQGSVALNKTVGRHQMAFGFDYTRLRIFHDSVFASVNYDNVPVADPQNIASTGQAVASFLLGLPSTANRIAGEADLDIRQDLYHYWFQDDFRVSSKLTVNLGLRYEYNQWPHHIRGRMGGFDMTSGQFYWVSKNPITGQPANAPETIANPDRNNWAPRIGFAYRVMPRTVVRGAYGIFYNANLGWEWSTGRGNWPYSVSQNLTGLNIAGAPLTQTDQLFTSFTPSNIPAQAQHTISRDLKMPYMQNWNFGIEHQLAQDLVLELNYQGSKGTNLSSFLSTNDPLPGPGDPNARRPYPQGGSLSELKTIATSHYNALTAKLEKRYARGLSIIASYAYQKNIDLNSEFGGSSPQNSRAYNLDMAPSGFDQTHVFNGSFIWQIPGGKNLPTLPKYIVSGWQTTGIITLETGRPFNIIVPFDNANVGSRGNFQRPNLVGDPFPSGWTKTYGPAGYYFNTAAFAVPAQYTYGNLGRNVLRGPGFHNVDFGLFKNFPLWSEATRLQFRAEAFNLLNNTNFSNPGTGITNADFGRITGTETLQRSLQFGLKLIF